MICDKCGYNDHGTGDTAHFCGNADKLKVYLESDEGKNAIADSLKRSQETIEALNKARAINPADLHVPMTDFSNYTPAQPSPAAAQEAAAKYLDEIDAVRDGEKFIASKRRESDSLAYVADDLSAMSPRLKWCVLFDFNDNLRAAYLLTRDGLNRTQLTIVDAAPPSRNALDARSTALEEAATICDEMELHYSAYKDTALLNGDVELSNAASGEPRAARFLAEKIRGLKGEKP